MDLDLEVKLAIYSGAATTGMPPDGVEVARRLGVSAEDVRAACARLAERRMLVLEPDGVTVRMAPPFSGVPTQHRVSSGSVEYFAPCAWDALGIPAALRRAATVDSRCEQSMEPLTLAVGESGPEASDWLFHCVVPASKWWDDIVFT